MRILTYIILIVLVLFGITFAGLNADSVSLNYYIGYTKAPLSLLLVNSFVIGGLLGLLVGFVLYIKTKTSNRRLQHRLKLVEAELANLRSLPLKDGH